MFIFYVVRNLLVSVAVAVSAASCAKKPMPSSAKPLSAIVETEPVLSLEDAADDPALWVHPTDPQLSLVIGTDKQYGLEVYGLDGRRHKRIAAGLTNNVDIRLLPSPWPVGTALLAASNRTLNTLSLFVMSPDGELVWLTESEVETGLNEVYGLCLFSNSEGIQAFVNDKDGRYQQWGLEITLRQGVREDVPFNDSTVLARGTLLREFAVSSQPEGCVADDTYERLFVGIEAEGVFSLEANANRSAALNTLAIVDGVRLTADVEGMDIFTVGQAGYLIVSSQGNSTYALFDRMPPHAYIDSFTLADDATLGIDGTSDTDGLAASSQIRTQRFPEGLVVVQDGTNTMPAGAQNFKLVSWQDIAQTLGL
ncbi:MAG: phytase [OM182 bacterium]|jgi:3-phytase|nr:phytase [Gammaproteobacteria bacterium]MDP4871046.1 phytase [Gammaproteobacteria bacterium]MDP4941966.1 phytase [OM182 bacterium]